MRIGNNGHTSLRMLALLALSDFLALFLVWFISVWLQRYVVDARLSLLLYWRLTPFLGLFIAANALVGLYPGILLSPPEELKKLTQSISVIFLALAAGLFLAKQSTLFSRAIFLMAWVGALVAVPVFRSILRRMAHRWRWWGHPAVIFGAGITGHAVAKALAQSHRLGLKPIVFLDDDPLKIGTLVHEVAVDGPLEKAKKVAEEHPDAVAILAMPGVSPERVLKVLEEFASEFRRVIIIPDLFGMSSLWISAFDLGGIIGLELHQKLLDKRRQLVKRTMEVGLIIIFLPILIPLTILLALLVSLDSPGSVFYGHDRIGMGGKEIRIWKFRTMVKDADAALEECLAKDPGLRSEWDENHKLVCDPRITRVGRILRNTSLDELPQLWNVLRGDLSLVGPRPIVWAEVDKYQAGFALYKKVKPGLTGLWQVSGRSDTSYAERVRLDAYYVRNWSVWFDIYILVKTPGEVFRCRGAC